MTDTRVSYYEFRRAFKRRDWQRSQRVGLETAGSRDAKGTRRSAAGRIRRNWGMAGIEFTHSSPGTALSPSRPLVILAHHETLISIYAVPRRHSPWPGRINPEEITR